MAVLYCHFLGKKKFFLLNLYIENVWQHFRALRATFCVFFFFFGIIYCKSPASSTVHNVRTLLYCPAEAAAGPAGSHFVFAGENFEKFSHFFLKPLKIHLASFITVDVDAERTWRTAGSDFFY